MNPNIFREYDIRGIVGDHLTDETVEILGKAIGTFFQQNNAKRIAIGYDALSANTIGHENVAVGEFALTSNLTGRDNVAIGQSVTR